MQHDGKDHALLVNVVKRDLKAMAPVVIMLGAAIGWQSLSPQLLQAGLWATGLGGGLWFVVRGWRNREKRLPLAVLPLAGFLIWQAIRSFGSSPLFPALHSVQLTAGALLAFVVIYDSLDSGLTRRHWENAILLLAGVFCALELTLASVWQLRWAAIAGTPFSLPPVGYRATGLLLQHPNVLSGFLNFAILLAVLRLNDETSTAKRVLWCLGLAVFGATQILTSSRGGWLSAALGLAVLVALLIVMRRRGSQDNGADIKPTRRLSRAWIIGAVLAAAVIVPLGWLAFRQIARVGHQPISNARRVVWTTGWQIFLQDPVFGAGPGAYPMLSPALTSTPPSFDANHAHDLWLQVASEEGLVGEALLLAAIGLILVPGLRALREGATDPELAAYLGIGASLLAQQVVDYMFGVVLYSMASLALLAIYLHLFERRKVAIGRWTWAGSGVVLVVTFITIGAWSGRGNGQYWEGIQAALQGEWNKAEAELCGAFHAFPDHPLYGYECGLAAAYAVPASEDLALSGFSASVNLPPAWAPESANLGASALANGDDGLAVASLRSAAIMAPRSWIFWLSLSRARACLGDPTGAASAYQLAIRAYPWLLAPGQQIPDWLPMQSLAVRPDEYLKGASAYRWWALQALANGEQDIAIRDARLGIQVYPRDAGLYATLAIALRDTDLETAQRQLKTALFIDATEPFVLEVASNLSASWGDSQAADSYAVRWAQTVMQTHYSEKYFYSVYHTFFLPVDLHPDLIRVTPEPQMMDRLKAIKESAGAQTSLAPGEVRAVEFALQNESLFHSCP